MKNVLLGYTNSYHGFSLEEALAGIAGAGFKYVELAAVKGWTEHVRADMSEDEILSVKKLIADFGLTAYSLSAPCNLADKGRLEDFKDNIELAHKLGCKYIITSTGEAHFGGEETLSDEVLVRNIKTLIPTLEKYGIVLALEIHGDYGTGEALYAITRELASPHVGINYDTANVVMYGGILPTLDVKTCVSDVKYVHIKDKRGLQKEWNFPGLGNGELPLREFIEFMSGSGYDGPYSVEIEYEEEFCMRAKDRPGDIDIANKEMADSFKFLSSVFGVK